MTDIVKVLDCDDLLLVILYENCDFCSEKKCILSVLEVVQQLLKHLNV